MQRIRWFNGQCPEITQHVRNEGGKIHWGDETGLVNTDVQG